MIADELETLVLADAIGALDPDERLELQARLDGMTAEQRSEVAGLYDVTAAMVLSVPSVSPSGSRPACPASVPDSGGRHGTLGRDPGASCRTGGWLPVAPTIDAIPADASDGRPHDFCQG